MPVPGTAFLNVDLDISSREDLTPLAAALERRLLVLHVGREGSRYHARFELRTEPSSPDLALRRLAQAIQSLPVRQQARWRRATTREFNIGIQAGREPHCSEFSVAAPTVAMVAKVGGRVVVTVYGVT